MSVLSIAGQEPATAEGTGTSETVAVGDRITHAVNDFLSGLNPFSFEVRVDWDTLSPIVSTISALVVLFGRLR